MKLKPKRVKGWKGFLAAIQDLREEYGSFRVSYRDGVEIERPNGLLFRGQPRADQKLTTTLERHSNRSWHIGSYVGCAASYVHEIETFTGERWHISGGQPEIDRILKEKQDWMHPHLPHYAYLVYLRHHGFPSPLLDWTESPFVAAYFAYIDGSAKGDSAVYCFMDRLAGVKGMMGGEPTIKVQGPQVTTDKRHFAQKAQYTIATTWNDAEQRHDFCSHEDVLNREDPGQDYVAKIILPGSQRGNILDALEDFNINHFTLFQSTDALIRTLGSREFEIRESSARLRSARLVVDPERAAK